MASWELSCLLVVCYEMGWMGSVVKWQRGVISGNGGGKAGMEWSAVSCFMVGGYVGAEILADVWH
jgi:hypothetical protein